MAPSFHLDPPTLVLANLIMSASTVGLLLITRFGLGASGNRMNGWIAGECLLLLARFGLPLAWFAASRGVDVPLQKLVPPLIVIGLGWHVVGLRQARQGAQRPDARLLAGSVAAVMLVWLVSQPFAEAIRIKSFMISLTVVWLAMLRESWPLARRSWGGRGLVLISVSVALANLVLAFDIDTNVHLMLYGPGLLIETVVVLLSTSCYLLWVQEDLRGKLTDQAATDALTGVLNRHGLMPRLEQALAGARSSGLPLSVVLCDLDHFKQVNDTWGHAMGDRVLQRFAEKACEATRRGDRVGRWGGEEFLLVLPDTVLSDAVAVAERLRRSFAGTGLGHGSEAAAQPLPPVTVSAGVACSSEGAAEGFDAQQLLALADERLYLAKTLRNCVAWRDGRPQVPTVLPIAGSAMGTGAGGPAAAGKRFPAGESA